MPTLRERIETDEALEKGLISRAARRVRRKVFPGTRHRRAIRRGRRRYRAAGLETHAQMRRPSFRVKPRRQRVQRFERQLFRTRARRRKPRRWF